MLDEILAHVSEIEGQCARLAPAVENHDWQELNRLITDMGRVRHALMNAWEAAASLRTPEFDREIQARIGRVIEYRAWYAERLNEYNGGVSERLTLISRWKAYARSVAGKPQKRAVLFSDIR